MKLVKFVGQELLDEVKQHHLIIYLKEEETLTIKIIDLPRLWMKNQDLYYLPNSRIVGEVETLLRFYGLEDEFDDAITGYNYEESDIFNNKLKEFDQWMTKAIIDNTHTAGKTIQDLLVVTKTPIQNNTNKNIIDKLNQLPFGKYMDVSDLNKIKYLNMNKKKFVATNIRIQSNNYDNFNYVINILPDGVNKYTEDLMKATIFFNIDKDQDKTSSLASTTDVDVPIKVVKKYERKPREKSFLQKLNLLKGDKALDVSTIDDQGHNTIVVDKKNLSKTYYDAIDINIVSNNFEAFMTAIELLPNGPTKYAGDIVLAKIHFGIVDTDEEIISDETS